MLERFLATHPATAATATPAPDRLSVDEFFELIGGRSFSNGLYRTHTKETGARADAWTRAAFPDVGERIRAFAFDWLGRHFCTDSARGPKDDPEVLMLEPGTAQALEIPVVFSTFHDGELVDYANEALASDFYAEWLTSGGAVPKSSECIGYRTPLFLGGEDEITNLETVDLDVYWTICGQMRRKVLGIAD